MGKTGGEIAECLSRPVSSAVERLPYKQDVAGSNPAPGIAEAPVTDWGLFVSATVCRVCDSLNYRSPAQRPASAVQHKLVLVTGRTVMTGGLAAVSGSQDQVEIGCGRFLPTLRISSF
jgi:hypothetical protein